MPRERPASVMVIAIFNIIFGVVGLGCCLGTTWTNVGLLQASSERSKESAEQARQLKELADAVPAQNFIEMSHLTLGILYSVFFLAAGVGLILMQNWARWVSLFTAVLALLLNTSFLVYEFAVVIPTMQELVRKQSQEQGQKDLGSFVASGVGGALTGWYLLSNLPWIIFGLVNVIILILPGVGAAFTADTDEQKEDRTRRRNRDEDEDEDDDRGKRWRD